MLRPKIAPMGWNSWDCYGAAVTENEVRQNAEFMASNLKQYGWEYVAWTASDSEGGAYLAVFNLGDEDGALVFEAEELELSGMTRMGTELWSGQTMELGDQIRVEIPRHGAKVYFFRNINAWQGGK